jgi:DNA-binding response OmpR family regulator
MSGIILLIEDDTDLNNANRRALEMKQYTVLTAKNLGEAKAHLNSTEPDIILLDVMLPDGNGFSFCEEIRERTRAHILFLTAKSEHIDRMRGLQTGGDDYITKPFHAGELLARVEAAMRRRRIGVPVDRLSKGLLTLDMFSNRATLNGTDLGVSQKEFDVLLLLIQNEEKTLPAEFIYEKVWGQPLKGDKNALQTAISKLRKKTEASGYDILMQRGKGYIFKKQ